MRLTSKWWIHHLNVSLTQHPLAWLPSSKFATHRSPLHGTHAKDFVPDMMTSYSDVITLGASHPFLEHPQSPPLGKSGDLATLSYFGSPLRHRSLLSHIGPVTFSVYLTSQGCCEDIMEHRRRMHAILGPCQGERWAINEANKINKDSEEISVLNIGGYNLRRVVGLQIGWACCLKCPSPLSPAVIIKLDVSSRSQIAFFPPLLSFPKNVETLHTQMYFSGAL